MSRVDAADAPISLFLIALPRSLSSHIFEAARSALGLATPRWTSAGEILNPDRWPWCAEGCVANRFHRHGQQALTESMHAFLDDVVQVRGHAYKDVLQPFVLAPWLNARDLRVLRIVRPIADVATAMLKAGWTYSANATDCEGPEQLRVLSGLRAAQAELARVPAVEIVFDEFIEDASVLSRALASLYPEIELAPIPAHGSAFLEYSREVMARRRTPQWRRLDSLTNETVGGSTFSADR